MRLVLVLAAALAGCAHTGYRAPLTCSGHGGPAWIEVLSPHFRVLTDQSRATAERTSRMLEETHAAFEKLFALGMVSRATPLGRVDLVAFGRREDYLEIGPQRSQAMFTTLHEDVEPRPTIVTWGPIGEGARNVLQHELSHRFVHATLYFCPLWLNEGLAEYFSTLELTDGLVRIGKRPRRHQPIASAAGVAKLPTLEQLLGASYATFNEAGEQLRYYRGAWALVHHLEHDKQLRPRFRDYQKRLANGEEPRPAFDAAFAGVDRAQLERGLQETADGAGVSTFEGRFDAPVAASAAPRVLDDAEVHLLFASLRPWTKNNDAAIRVDLAEAARVAPDAAPVAHLRARYDAAYGRLAEAETEARQAVSLGGDDPTYPLTLAAIVYRRTLKTPAPHDWKPLRALLKPLWTAARTASSLNLLGWVYAEMGEPDLALPFAKRAVETDPGCWQCFDTLARVRGDQGFVDEAIPLLERALALLPEQVRMPAMVTRLERYRAAAKGQPSPAP